MKRVILKINSGRRYLFHPSTKSIEFLNSLCLFFFGLVLLFNSKALLIEKFYINFNYAGPSWVWFVVMILGIIQFNAMKRDTLESNIVSAILLKVSSLIWFLIAIMFASDYPPLSTAFFTYMSLSLINVLAGYELSEQNTFELLLREENRND